MDLPKITGDLASVISSKLYKMPPPRGTRIMSYRVKNPITMHGPEFPSGDITISFNVEFTIQGVGSNETK
jgi:hypothetical protein